LFDPHTGEVKAMVGGRNYGMSQLDHTVANRPSGSAFKPFVYAAALNSGLGGGENVMTTSTIVDDDPKTFPGTAKITRLPIITRRRGWAKLLCGRHSRFR
jgi:membrane peptidoglycan carboxypeptidase